jgi:hypothetical protein
MAAMAVVALPGENSDGVVDAAAEHGPTNYAEEINSNKLQAALEGEMGAKMGAEMDNSASLKLLVKQALVGAAKAAFFEDDDNTEKEAEWKRLKKELKEYRRTLPLEMAMEHEKKGMYDDAERLYLSVNEPDLAINMYKKAREFDQMIRLVSQYRKELLKDTNLHLAQLLEMEGSLREAEKYYCEAGEWASCVNMWRANDSWDEAIRVAKIHGGQEASLRVAYAWALSIGGMEGRNLLTRLGLIELAIDYAIEIGDFDYAFELATNSMKKKLPDVHFKHALYLEDEEKFEEVRCGRGIEFLAPDLFIL